MKLRVKLLLSYVLVVAVTLVSVVLIVRYGAAREVGRFMTDQGMVDQGDLARIVENYYRQNGTWNGVERVLPVLGGRGMMGGQRVRITNGSGVVVYDSRGGLGEVLPETELANGVVIQDSNGKKAGILLAEGGMAGAGMRGNGAQAGVNLLARLTNAILNAAWIGGSLALLVALGIGYQLLRPVSELTRASRAMAGGDLGQRVAVRGDDELAELGKDFNLMAEALERSEKNRRSMTADVAHELRTPIAVQRAHLEALQDGIYPLTAENLQPVMDQTEMLSRLVDDLRTLALADAGELVLKKTSIHPLVLLNGVMERFRAEADHRQINIRLETPSTPLPALTVDPGRIEQILNNLVGNALRYTPEGGVIRLVCEMESHFLVFRVQDSGSGIPEDALPHLFERFYRADRARSRDEGGTGLGLAISRQLALAHGGELFARNQPVGGAEFVLKLPAF